MNFHEAQSPFWCTHRIISENDLVEIFVYPVMFGMRVRAGFVDDSVVQLDWCAGDGWTSVERLYSICQAILTQRKENLKCFSGIPRLANIKPFFNDHEFTEIVLRLAGDFEPVKLPFQNFTAMGVRVS